MKKYIAGILTVIIAIPILESLTELAQVVIEVPKGYLTKRVLEINRDIQELQESSETTSTECIGFQIPSEDSYDEE